jgi:tetratricopeptide (TPR) repeat protein
LKIAGKLRTQAVRQTPMMQPSRVWHAVGLLVVAVSAAYANSFHGPFIFDDKPSIIENESLRHLGSLQVLAASPDAVTTTGRPALNLSLAVNYAVGGLKVEGYHAVNLAIHILAALALFGLLRRTLLLPALAPRFGPASTGLALTVALLWAVHPLETESVTYIVQRAEAMVGLFYLATLYCFVRGSTSVHANRWYAAAVVACALGMASKEVMVSAPLVVLLYDRFFIAASFKDSLRRRWRWWLAMFATWAILALLVYQSQHRGGSAGFGLGMTSLQYARRQLGCIMHYLRLCFWPSPLVLDYGNTAVRDASALLPSALGVFLLVAATVAALILQPKWGFLGVCFFAFLAPTSSIVPLPGQIEAEHRMYLPLATVVTLFVLGAHQVLAHAKLRSRIVVPMVVAAAALALGLGTYRRNEVYQSELAVWDSAVRNSAPNYRAYHNRGNAYLARGQRDLAIKDFEKVVELTPRDPKAYNGRGNVYSAVGRHDEAIKDYDKAISLKPDYADAYNGRGTVYGSKGAVDAAIEDFNTAIRLEPAFAEAYFNRGNAYGAKGQVSEAIRDYDKAIALRSDYAAAYNSRGRAHDSKGEVDAAIKDFDQAIAFRPDYAEAYNNRGGAYDGKGQIETAIKDYDKALALNPDYAEAYSNRGNAYQGQSRFEAAVRDYDKAIALKPDFTVAYYNRAIAHSQMRAHDKAWSDLMTFQKLGGTPDPSIVEELSKASRAMK